MHYLVHIRCSILPLKYLYLYLHTPYFPTSGALPYPIQSCLWEARERDWISLEKSIFHSPMQPAMHFFRGFIFKPLQD